MMLVLFRCSFFFFNDTATTEIYTLSLHDALPIYAERDGAADPADQAHDLMVLLVRGRSEEHTSELQSHLNLVCRRPLEKKHKQLAARNSLRHKCLSYYARTAHI